MRKHEGMFSYKFLNNVPFCTLVQVKVCSMLSAALRNVGCLYMGKPLAGGVYLAGKGVKRCAIRESNPEPTD